MSTTLSISPWGNSHGIRLSRELMQAMEVTPDTPLEVRVVAPVRKSLAQKLRAWDPALHGGELLSDAAVGAEFGAR